MVVANAGTPLAGHTDNINRLRAICDDYGVWLHAEGWVQFPILTSYSDFGHEKADNYVWTAVLFKWPIVASKSATVCNSTAYGMIHHIAATLHESWKNQETICQP